jgi:hypothetical protein
MQELIIKLSYSLSMHACFWKLGQLFGIYNLQAI